jgi:hypothetical protein
VEHILEIAPIYARTQSLTQTAQYIGPHQPRPCTREAIRQLLLKGRAHGLIDYKPKHLRYRQHTRTLRRQSATSIASRYPTLTSFRDLANAINMPLQRLLQSLTPRQHQRLQAIFHARVQHRRKHHTIQEYCALVARLGFHPSTTIMDHEIRTLSIRIRRYWGGISQFRTAHQIPLPTHGNRMVGARNRDTRKTQLLRAITEHPVVGMSTLRSRDRALARDLIRQHALRRTTVRRIQIVTAPGIDPTPLVRSLLQHSRQQARRVPWHRQRTAA